MASMDIVDGQHARPFAAPIDRNTGEGADAVVVEQPLNVYGQVPAGYEASNRNRILNIGGLLPEVKGCNLGWDLGNIKLLN